MRHTHHPLVLALCWLPAVTLTPSCGGPDPLMGQLHRQLDSINPPTITAPSGSITITQGTGFVISGAALAGATINVYDNGALTPLAATAGAGGAFSLSVTPAAPGFHIYRCTQTLSGLTSGPSTLILVTVNPAADTDQDGVVDTLDNCVTTPNRDQQDHDQDGIGDVCDRAITKADGTNSFHVDDVYSVAVPISGGGGDSTQSALFSGYKARVQLPAGALNSTFEGFTMALVQTTSANWNIQAYRDNTPLSYYLRRINQSSGLGVPPNQCLKVRIRVGPAADLASSLNEIKVTYRDTPQSATQFFLNNCNGSPAWSICSEVPTNHCVRAFVDGDDVLAEFTLSPI